MKAKAYVYNLVILALCVAVIVLYFVFPLVRVTATCELSSEELEKYLTQTGGVADKDDNAPLVVTVGYATPVKKDSGNSGKLPSFSFSIEIPTTTVVTGAIEGASNKEKVKETISQIVEQNIEKVMTQIETTIQENTDTIIKVALTPTLRNALKDVMFESVEGEYTDAEMQEKLDSVGLTDAYIDEELEILIEAFTADGATIDSVKQTCVNVVNQVTTKLKESGNPELKDITIDEQQVADAIEEFLRNDEFKLVDENGNILKDSFFDSILGLLAELLAEMQNPNGDVATLATAEETQTNMEKLKTQLSAMLLDILPEGFEQYAYYGILALAIYLGLSILPWAYLIIKILAKIASKNPAIKVKAPILFGWSPFVLFMVLPTVLLLSMSALLPAGIAINFFSSGVFAAIAALLLIIIWIPYRKVRTELKNQVFAEKWQAEKQAV